MYHIIAHHHFATQSPWPRKTLGFTAISSALPSDLQGHHLLPGDDMDVDGGQLTLVSTFESLEQALKQMLDMHRRGPQVGAWAPRWAAAGLAKEDILLVLTPSDLISLDDEATRVFMTKFARASAYEVYTAAELIEQADTLCAFGEVGGYALDPDTVFDTLRDWNDLWQLANQHEAPGARPKGVPVLN